MPRSIPMAGAAIVALLVCLLMRACTRSLRDGLGRSGGVCWSAHRSNLGSRSGHAAETGRKCLVPIQLPCLFASHDESAEACSARCSNSAQCTEDQSACFYAAPFCGPKMSLATCSSPYLQQTAPREVGFQR